MLGSGEGLLGLGEIAENTHPPLPPLPQPLPPNRRRAKPHRRLHTEPSGRVLGGALPPSGGAMSGGTMKGKKNQHTSSTNFLPSHQPLPPPPPPMFHPFCNPYSFPYFPPYPFPYYHPQLFPPDWSQEHAPFPYVPPQNTETEALDLATPLQYPHGIPLDYYNGYYRNMLKFSNAKLHPQGNGGVSTGPPPKQEQSNSKQVDERPPKRQSQPRDIASRPSDHVETEPPAQKTTLNLETLDKIVCEVLNSCEERVMSVRSQCGKDSPAATMLLLLLLSLVRESSCW